MVSRRHFLRGRLSGGVAPRRPPWHLPEDEFAGACTRCGQCIAACPTRIVAAGTAGFPEVGFASGACTFCAACTHVCPSGALRFGASQSPWTLRAGIGNACLAYGQVLCRSCGEACDTQAIRFPPRIGGVPIPILSLDACTGCGACVGVCPVAAIGVEVPRASAAQPERITA